jgi:hypothetical protein
MDRFPEKGRPDVFIAGDNAQAKAGGPPICVPSELEVERTIASFKTWRIMHTDYRRPLKTFQETISTVVALHFCATA